MRTAEIWTTLRNLGSNCYVRDDYAEVYEMNLSVVKMTNANSLNMDK